MHAVAQRQDMSRLDFPPHAQHHGPPRRHNTTALDTQNIGPMSTHHHPSHSSQSQSHMRVNSLSSGGSLSDYSSVLRTPQDSNQSDNDALIVKQQEDATSGIGGNGWKPSMGMVQEQLTSSPIEETFARAGQGVTSVSGKPMSMQINTSFAPRPRPMAYSAHPNQKQQVPPSASHLPAPQSATAAFPPMQLPAPAATASAGARTLTRGQTQVMGRGIPSASPETSLQDSNNHGQHQPSHHHPAPGQHRRTQSAPLHSLSPHALNSTPAEIAANINPLSPPLTAGNQGANRSGYPQPQHQDLGSLQPVPYPQMNAMTQGAPAFTPFPTMSPFQGGVQGVSQVPPMLWSPFFPQQSPPGPFYSPRPPAPQAPSLAGANNNNMYSPPPPMPTTQWKINPNSQPQMPLSHLINQAQGLFIGGPSAHNRKIGLYKTEICRNWEEKQSCRYGVKCQFAHGTADIRTVPRHPKYKTEICRTFWVTGSCPYGKRCCFIHPTATSQQTGPLSPAGPPIMGMINAVSPSTDDQDRDTQHTISLLARLDIKRSSPEQVNGSTARQTPDSNNSDPSGFVYPGMHLNGHSNGAEADRSTSGPRH